MTSIGKLKNEIKTEFNDFWDQKMSSFLAQFVSFSEQIIE